MTVALALATLVSVLAGTVAAGGTVTPVGATTLAVLLAVLTLGRRPGAERSSTTPRAT